MHVRPWRGDDRGRGQQGARPHRCVCRGTHHPESRNPACSATLTTSSRIAAPEPAFKEGRGQGPPPPPGPADPVRGHGGAPASPRPARRRRGVCPPSGPRSGFCGVSSLPGCRRFLSWGVRSEKLGVFWAHRLLRLPSVAWKPENTHKGFTRGVPLTGRGRTLCGPLQLRAHFPPPTWLGCTPLQMWGLLSHAGSRALALCDLEHIR